MLKRPSYTEYNDFIYDYNTSNVSFIALASILRRKIVNGKHIKNYNFFLKLYDEDLVGVDPRDPNLSAQMKVKILYEVRRNFWYFLREIMMIPETGGGTRFKLHRGNLAMAWSCLMNLPTYCVLPRQHGKTWMVIAYALWVFNFSSDYTNMLFLNKQLKDSELNLKRLKDARELLPDYLRMDKIINSKGEIKEGRSNVQRLTNALHNQIDVKASARNPIAADELGRGMTVAWVWIDELAFVQFNRIIYAAMSPAWSKAAEIAISKNKPIGKILTTTPSDLSTDMGDFAYSIRNDSAWFDESLYDMDANDISEWMEKTSKNGYLYIEFQYYQLDHKNPDKWFKEQCKDLLFDWVKIRREILLQWNNAATNSPFDENDLRDLHAMMINESDSDSIVINKYYKLNVYRPLNVGDRYLVGVDVAKGRGSEADRTSICVVNASTGFPHAIFKSNVIQYKETFRFLHTLVYHYIPNSVLIIENNIDTLIEYVRESTMKHLLYFEKADKSAAKETRKSALVKDKNRSTNIIYGINTNTTTRPKYFDILFEYVRTNKDNLCVRELVEEIETLEYKSPTRVEATSGKHDDVVISYLLTQYVMQYGTNKPRFGLFYSDGVAKEYKTLDKSIFSSSIDNFAYTKSSNSNMSPFFQELLDAYEKNETDIDEQTKNFKPIYSKNDKIEKVSHIFNDSENGMTYASNNSFFGLNDSKVDDNIYSGNAYEHGSTEFEFIDKDPIDWF